MRGTGPRMPGSLWTEWAAAVEASYDRLSVRAEGGAGGGPRLLDRGDAGARSGESSARRSVDPARPLPGDPVQPVDADRRSALARADRAGHAERTASPRRHSQPRDPSRVGQARPRFRTFSLASTVSALALIERVKPTVGAITAPTLILQGKRDTVVEPSGAVWLVDHLGSEDKRLVWFARSDHLLAWDHDRESVVGTCLMFFDDERRTHSG